MNWKVAGFFASMITICCIIMFASISIPWGEVLRASGEAQPVHLLPLSETARENPIPEEAAGQEEPAKEKKQEAREEESSLKPEEENLLEEEGELAETHEDDPGQEEDQPAEEPSEDEDLEKERSEAREDSPASREEIIQQTEPEYRDAQEVTAAPQLPVEQLMEQVRYPPQARRQGREGVVLLQLYISAEGVIERIEVLEDPGYGMAEAARRAFEGITAEPAEHNGVPAAVTLRFPVRFSLQ